MKLLFAFLQLSICLYALPPAYSQAAEIEVPNMALLKITFCACQCCEKDAKCPRHQDIPEDFTCEKTTCNKEFCNLWGQAKCSKDCFCHTCAPELKNDYRCIDFTKKSDQCKCSEEYDCSVDPAVKEVNDLMSPFLEDDNSCNIPCYCKKCGGRVPRQVYADCIRLGEPDSSCDCSKNDDKMECVGEEKPEKIVQEEDIYMGFDEAEECRLGCFCKKCGAKSPKVEQQCNQMKPDGNFMDCECKWDEIHCPTDAEVDELTDEKAALCKISCFCKQCKSDPRMVGMMKESCKGQQGIPEGCKCQKEDCDMLDKLNAVDEKMKKRKQEL